MAGQSSLFPSGAVFTVARELVPSPPSEYREKVSLGREDRPPSDPTFDLAVIEFNDDGSFVDAGQKRAVADCIAAARRSNRNGALVVIFIHGWHHTARWDPSEGSGDTHFAAFRKVLMSLALREAERYRPEGPIGRRVVGVYLAWQGDPTSWFGLLRETWLTHFTFFGRYGTAKRIGSGDALRMTIREIVDCTKGPPPRETPDQPESPLTLVGHSMGALMLESAFLALLADRDAAPIKAPAPYPRSCVQVMRAGEAVSFPDVVIGLNSAADSRITRAVVRELEARQLSKSVNSEAISYSPPLFVSATSTDDWVTKVIWRLAFNFFRRTGGHDRTLFTHTFNALESNVMCSPKIGKLEFGQNWSCLRLPHPPDAPSPAIPIDLPELDRSEEGGPSHIRYQLSPLAGRDRKNLAWIFQLPPRISAEHNDIFNTRSSLLMLALMQISGAVMSLAEEWKDNFEPLPH
jgi:hypothetical protein